MEQLTLIVIILGVAAFALGLASSIKPVRFVGIESKRAGLIVMVLGIAMFTLAGTAAYLMKCC